MAMRIMVAPDDDKIPGLISVGHDSRGWVPLYRMSLIDSHCHLDATAFDADRKDVLARCAAAGIEAIVVPGVRLPDFPSLRAVCASSPLLHAAYGLHPLFLAHHQPEDLGALRNW